MIKTLYKRYYHMKERCYNPNDKRYNRYGGRGIKICDEWLNDYNTFEQWAINNGFEEHLEIDRINNDGNYAPDNCRFVTSLQNNRNRSKHRRYTYNGKTKVLSEWCEELGLKYYTVLNRLRAGWSFEDAITKPAKKGRDTTSMIGQRFGRLVVLEYAGDEYIGSDNNSRYICKCDCGNTAIVGQNKLKSGHTRSCGCLQREIVSERQKTNNSSKKKSHK